MELLEVYFWMIIIISCTLSILIILFTEDLKSKKRFTRLIKSSFLFGLIGIFMVVTDWNYICGHKCLIFTFSPFITLIVCKTIMTISKKITKKEGFQFIKNELVDGLYQENKGNLEFKTYYTFYTGFIMATPIIILVALLQLFENITC